MVQYYIVQILHSCSTNKKCKLSLVFWFWFCSMLRFLCSTGNYMHYFDLEYIFIFVLQNKLIGSAFCPAVECKRPLYILCLHHEYSTKETKTNFSKKSFRISSKPIVFQRYLFQKNINCNLLTAFSPEEASYPILPYIVIPSGIALNDLRLRRKI